MIARAAVEQLFDELRREGIDPEKELTWNYYFTDEDSSERLQKCVPKLEKDGYKFVSIYLAEPGSEPSVLDGRQYENPPLYALQVQKIESHTIHSLDRRNSSLQDFADDNDIFAYDGMSVGTKAGVPFKTK
jgi:hypothetical protein